MLQCKKNMKRHVEATGQVPGETSKGAPTIETDQPFASDEVAVPPDDSVAIRRTFASADTPLDTTPVLPDGWNAQDAAAHLKKRSWLRILDDGALVCSACSELHSLGVEVEEIVRRHLANKEGKFAQQYEEAP